MNKKTITIVIIVAVLILAGIGYWASKKGAVVDESDITTTTQTNSVVEETQKEDSVSSINKDLSDIKTNDLNTEFQNVDENLKGI